MRAALKTWAAVEHAAGPPCEGLVRYRRLWLSPPVLILLWIAIVDLLWLIVFLFNLVAGDARYVFPQGLHDFIAARLTVRGVDLSIPAVTLYNVALVLGPLVPLLFADFRYWARAEGELAVAWARRHHTATIGILAGSIAVALAFIPLSDITRLPYLQDRVRWATDWFPLPVPIDPPLLVRTEYLLTRVIDARYSFVLAGLAFHGMLAAFLIRAFGGWPVAVPVGLVYFAVVANWRTLYFLNGAEAEFPAAAFALMGLVAVTRRRYVLGVWAFFVGLLFKETALFYGFAAIGLVVWWMARRRARLAELPWGLAVSCAVVVLLFWAGLLFNSFQLRGGGYLFSTSEYAFLVTSLSVFVADLVANYPAQIALAIVGLAWSVEDRLRWATLAGALLLVRSTTAAAGEYYTTFFMPLIGFLAAGFVVRLWSAGMSSPQRCLAIAACAGALAVNAVVYVALPDKASWTSRASSGWDSLISSLQREVPRGATVYFRKISPRYDLEHAERRDLTWFELSEGEAQLRTLSRPGPVVYIAPYRDLRGADGPLAALGYRELVPAFGPAGTDRFVVLLKP